jgi:hypothetical protein
MAALTNDKQADSYTRTRGFKAHGQKENNKNRGTRRHTERTERGIKKRTRDTVNQHPNNTQELKKRQPQGKRTMFVAGSSMRPHCCERGGLGGSSFTGPTDGCCD